jgi:mannose-1-phosphate guanylyltransferase
VKQRENMALDVKIDHFYAVIMAGGGGTRIWPLSRHDHPKQMLALSGGRSLFQLSIDRLQGLFPLDRILVVTSEEQASAYLKQVPGLSAYNFLLEPEPKGTAAVVAWAAEVLFERDPESVMAVLTADHLIQNERAFQEILATAFQLAQKDYLVTLGIKPISAHTGYGYIHFGSTIGDFGKYPAYRVIEFKEKPDQPKAEQFVKSRDHAWNSGMFIWKTKTVLGEFQKFMPELMVTIKRFCSEPVSSDKIGHKETWRIIQPQTIDYGIMEKAKNVGMIQASDLKWNDVGSWESLFEVFPTDENGNILLKGCAEKIETTGSLIFSENPQKLIASIGVKDMIIIDTADALLICPRKDSQKVRDLVNLLKSKKLTMYL